MSESRKQVAGQLPGKMSARERIEQIINAGTFVEIDKYLERSNAVLDYPDVSAPGEGVIAGWGQVDARPVCIFAEDYAVLKGSFSAAHAAKIIKVLDMAAKSGMPVICIWDSGGARVQEGAAVLRGYGQVLNKLTDLSGVTPTISVVAGDMFGSAALLAPLTDFTIAIDKVSAVSVYSPMVLAATEGRDVDKNALCGAEVQNEKMGTAHFLCANEAEACLVVKQLLSYLPSNNLEEAPFGVETDIAQIAADPTELRGLIEQVADDGQMLEVQPGYAPGMLTGFAMINGFSVGIVANAPGAYLSPKSCIKAARFIRILNAFDIPIVTFVSNEGAEVDIGLAQSFQTRALAKLAYAYAEATAPKVTIIAGKAVGVGFTAMASAADLTYAYPNAEISCVNAEAGAIILYDGDKSRAEEYREKFASPMAAAQQGVIDDIIEVADTRIVLSRALEMASGKREQKLPKKHGVMPL